MKSKKIKNVRDIKLTPLFGRNSLIKNNTEKSTRYEANVNKNDKKINLKRCLRKMFINVLFEPLKIDRIDNSKNVIQIRQLINN